MLFCWLCINVLNLNTSAVQQLEGSYVATQRHINLNLFTIVFPITAIVSIFHRISGVILFISLPWFLNLLMDVLYYPELLAGYNFVLSWFVLTNLGYHLLAGIRHLIMDIGFIEERSKACISAYVVLLLSALLSIIIGWRICYL